MSLKLSVRLRHGRLSHENDSTAMATIFFTQEKATISPNYTAHLCKMCRHHTPPRPLIERASQEAYSDDNSRVACCVTMTNSQGRPNSTPDFEQRGRDTISDESSSPSVRLALQFSPLLLHP